MSKKTYAGLSALLMSCACSTVGVTSMRANVVPRPESCALDVFSAESEIGRPYEVVCLIDARTGTSVFADRTGAGAINEARPYACKCGADGILVGSASSEGDGFVVPRTGAALLKAIRYK